MSSSRVTLCPTIWETIDFNSKEYSLLSCIVFISNSLISAILIKKKLFTQNPKISNFFYLPLKKMRLNQFVPLRESYAL